MLQCFIITYFHLIPHSMDVYAVIILCTTHKYYIWKSRINDDHRHNGILNAFTGGSFYEIWFLSQITGKFIISVLHLALV